MHTFKNITEGTSPPWMDTSIEEAKCLHSYLNRKYGVISTSHFFALLQSIRQIVTKVVTGEEVGTKHAFKP